MTPHGCRLAIDAVPQVTFLNNLAPPMRYATSFLNLRWLGIIEGQSLRLCDRHLPIYVLTRIRGDSPVWSDLDWRDGLRHFVTRRFCSTLWLCSLTGCRRNEIVPRS